VEPSGAAAHGAPVLRTISPILPVPDVTAAIRFYRELAKQAVPQPTCSCASMAGACIVLRCRFTPR